MVKSIRVYINHNIRASQIRCINQNNENIGIVSKLKGIELAESVGLDLIQVSSYRDNEIPTCKIMNYGKYKYELSKKNRTNAKRQREGTIKIKEIKFRPTTDINDLKTKAKRASDFIKEGCRVKIVVFFKGREIQYKHLASERLDIFFSLMDVGIIKFGEPKFDGRTMSMLLAPDKNKSSVTEKAS